jgi:hypothetical protein
VTHPRLCALCGVKPIGYHGRKCCYECVPRQRKRPLLCKRCGSDTNYFAAGLCRRCHRLSPLIDSCRDCLAWGVTRHEKWLCQACRGWRRHYDIDECPSCRRDVVVNQRGLCRLCCRQATTRTRQRHSRVDVVGLNGNGQQLFFADQILKQRNTRARTPTQPAPDTAGVWPAGYPVMHRQLALFYSPLELRDACDVPAPAIPALAAALDRAAADHGKRHGWSRPGIDATRRAIRVLLGTQDTPGAPIKTTEAAAIVAQLPNSAIQSVLDVLAATGMLDDDREAPLETWFATQIAGLTEPMATEVRQWFVALRDGSTTTPRSHPRRIATVRHDVWVVLPALHAWHAAGHTSLREITRQDIIGVLPAQARSRAAMLIGLRSLFRLLKARRLVFTNPTARMRAERTQPNQPLPIDLNTVRDAINSTNPARATLAALIAFHGPRNAQLRDLQLTDIRDGRMFLPGHTTVVLAQPVRDRLAAWFAERARRWPNTANAHLFVNFYTAVRTCPVSRVWISSTLGFSPQKLREDRILHEALATGGDVRRLCDLFGLTVGGAERYAATVAHPDLEHANR